MTMMLRLVKITALTFTIFASSSSHGFFAAAAADGHADGEKCVTGEGEFVFRSIIPSQFKLNSCLDEEGSASGFVTSGMLKDDPTDVFVYKVHCMHFVKDSEVYLGTNIEKLSPTQIEYQERTFHEVYSAVEEDGSNLGG